MDNFSKGDWLLKEKMGYKLVKLKPKSKLENRSKEKPNFTKYISKIVRNEHCTWKYILESESSARYREYVRKMSQENKMRKGFEISYLGN